MSRDAQAFWTADPLNKPREYHIRMQMCLTPAEYLKQRQPYYVRFLTKDSKIVHIPIVKYTYVRDCVLELIFNYNEPNAFPVQTPILCFDRDDVEQEKHRDQEPLMLYGKLSSRVAVLRNELELYFPNCKQMDIGFMQNELMLFLRLKGNFMVAVSSDRSVPIFTWDRQCVIPYDQARPKLGDGFKFTIPNLDGTADTFWYQSDRVQLFATVKKVVEYADRCIYVDGQTRIDATRNIRSLDIIEKSDILRAQIYHLSCAFGDFKVATFSRVSHAIKVYVDLQWRCEVGCVCDCVCSFLGS